MKRNTRQLIPMIVVFTLIAAAYSCRMLAMLDICGVYVNYIRAALYLLLFSLWGYSQMPDSIWPTEVLAG